MANDKVRILTPKNPIGRLIQGSVGRAQEKDSDGKPYLIKNGPKAGQPTVKYYIGVAIPKQPNEQTMVHEGVTYPGWVQSDWGKQIWTVGQTAFPGIANSPTFAWKIDDGDSMVPNTKGKRNCDNPNMRGCWILHCSTSLPIKACNADGSAAIDAAQIKCGYYVQVAIMVQGNSSSQKPGIYLNPEAVALAGVGEEIVQGMDTSSVGFGGGVLPPGATLPPNLLTPPPAAGIPAPAYPVPGTSVPPPAYPVPAAAPAPNAAILGVPAAPGIPVPPVAAPVAPPAPPAAPAGPQPTAKAAGATLAQMLAWPGWNLDSLKANGYVA